VKKNDSSINMGSGRCGGKGESSKRRCEAVNAEHQADNLHRSQNPSDSQKLLDLMGDELEIEYSVGPNRRPIWLERKKRKAKTLKA
jgi:hypothetical protein